MRRIKVRSTRVTTWSSRWPQGASLLLLVALCFLPLALRANPTTTPTIAGGGMFTLFLNNDGSLWTVGANDSGQLGDGTTTRQLLPKKLVGNVTQVVAGFDHTLFIKSDGSLWGAGDNFYGALGDYDQHLTPVQITTAVKSVTAGDAHTLFVKQDGTLWAMGGNAWGQLGAGSGMSQTVPIQVTSGVQAVAAGHYHSLFVKTDGTLWAMGDNEYGQLGDGTKTGRYTPVQVASSVQKVAAGFNFSLFLKTDGTLWAMGHNAYGQLGDGTLLNRSTPVQVATGVQDISCGSYHTLILKTNGSLVGTGWNTTGQLAVTDPPTSNGYHPNAVSIATNVRAIAAGDLHTLYVTADGRLFAVGLNSSGQLGDGSTIDRYTPVLVATGAPTPTPTPSPSPSPSPSPTPTTIQFNASLYVVGEGDQRVTLTVARSGNTSGAASADFVTSDSAGSQNCNVFNGRASSRCDYLTSIGPVQFAAGETSKTFSIPIIDDSYAEGNETFTVSLNNPSGASLGAQSATTVMIVDNESVTGPDPIDQSSFFAHKHYLDFLNREPDASGLAFWTNEITLCGTNQSCIDIKRINVSAAFFLSIEFQETGYLVERIYKASYGDGTGTSTFGGTHQLSVPIVRLNEFLPDTQKIGRGVIVGQTGWQTALENNKQAFASEFVQRSRFTTAFPTSMTPAQFVDKLFLNAGVTPSASDRTAAINEFGSATTTSDVAARSRALRRVAENATLSQSEFNRAFVLMQFLGYLRRNPNDPQDSDYTGYDFWLTKLNQFNGNFVNAEMVKAFIVSGEYRQRFGP
jgi:alpha-tubulin suppressor-like RCC1 family protein